MKENKAYYANRWINTARLKQEKAYGRPVFAKIGELTGKIGLLTLLSQQFKKVFGLLDLSKGSGQGNTRKPGDLRGTLQCCWCCGCWLLINDI